MMAITYTRSKQGSIYAFDGKKSWLHRGVRIVAAREAKLMSEGKLKSKYLNLGDNVWYMYVIKGKPRWAISRVHTLRGME